VSAFMATVRGIEVVRRTRQGTRPSSRRSGWGTAAALGPRDPGASFMCVSKIGHFARCLTQLSCSPDHAGNQSIPRHHHPHTLSGPSASSFPRSLRREQRDNRNRHDGDPGGTASRAGIRLGRGVGRASPVAPA
jgi:hypothetical protein